LSAFHQHFAQMRETGLLWRRLGSAGLLFVLAAVFLSTLAALFVSFGVVALSGGNASAWLISSACFVLLIVEAVIGARFVASLARRLWAAG
jgi:hypothetical protein